MSLGICPGGQQALCGTPEYQRGDELLQHMLWPWMPAGTPTG